MATRALIGIEEGKGYKVIYNHWDGYPEYLGRVLKKYYKNKNKVEKLINLGDLSRVGKKIGRKHDFDTAYEKHPDWTIAYGRDRGEENVGPRFLTEEEIGNGAVQVWAEYVYLYKNGKWHSYKVVRLDDRHGTLEPIDKIYSKNKKVEV
jgi:hypothetical protein